MSVSPPPPKRSIDRPACNFCIVFAPSCVYSPSEPGKKVMALGPGEQMLHPETGETARVMERQDLTRSPWQTFRFDSDGCIACVGQPTLVLTGTARAGGIMYLHRKCDELMRQGLQQWEPMETRQSLPLSPAPGELPRTLCQLRLQHHSFYVDFNMLQQASEPPIMYPQRDKPNQLLILEPQTVRILHHSVTHSPHREILDLPAAADAAAVPSDVSDCWDAYRHTGKKLVTLLHISDTHMLHRTLRPADLPAADILVHTGDFTNNGTDAEFEDFNNWLASQRPRFKHIVIICGNHEFRTRLQSPDVLSRDFAKKRLSNATHVLHHEMAVIEGIRFFGSPWSPWSEYENPDIMPYNAGHADVFKRWAKLPEARDSLGVLRVNAFDQITRLPGAGSAIDVLLTHGPPHGIFDKMENTTQSWGSSRQLRARIEGVGGVGAHLFGHVHEQRGYWEKREMYDDDGYDDVWWAGGCEYEARPGVKWTTFSPPPTHYPCQFISCNAMNNHGGLDGRQSCIAGPGRLIYARKYELGWKFFVDPQTGCMVRGLL